MNASTTSTIPVSFSIHNMWICPRVMKLEMFTWDISWQGPEHCGIQESAGGAERERRAERSAFLDWEGSGFSVREMHGMGWAKDIRHYRWFDVGESITVAAPDSGTTTRTSQTTSSTLWSIRFSTTAITLPGILSLIFITVRILSQRTYLKPSQIPRDENARARSRNRLPGIPPKTSQSNGNCPSHSYDCPAGHFLRGSDDTAVSDSPG